MSEPITSELRRKMDTLGWYDENGNIVCTTGGTPVSEIACLVINSETFGELCDAIDVVHKGLERENDRLKCELDRVTGEMEEHHAWAPESHYMMLPKDADGEPIHIGDVMDSKVDYLFDGKPFTVCGLVLCEDGWEVTDGRFGNRYEPNSLRHHHAPTVEDVLREFASDIADVLGGDDFRLDDSDELFAEYAAKLRLAGDAE